MNFHLSRAGFEFATRNEIFQAFFVGVRFDVLVLGFLMIPVVTLGAIMMMVGIQEEFVNKSAKAYFTLIWSYIVGVSFWSLPYYVLKGRHLRWATDGLRFIWPHFDTFTTVVTALIFLFILVSPIKNNIGRRNFMLGNQWHRRFDKGGPVQIVFRLLIPLLLVALAARGTVSAHHLEKEHAEVSQWENVNELGLNAPWAVSK